MTDNDSTMIATIREGDSWIRIPCFNHTLQLAIQDMHKDLDESFHEMMHKAKRVIAFVNKSTRAQELLKTVQEPLHPEKKPLKLIQENVTRWNSTYLMLKRFLQLKRAINDLNSNDDLNLPETLTRDEWKILTSYVSVLSNLTEATKLMEGENYVSASLYVQIILGLKTVLEPTENTDTFERALLETLKSKINARFDPVIQSEPLIIAMVIDPRFKTRLVSDAHVEDVKDIVIEAMLENFVHEEQEESVAPQPSASGSSDSNSSVGYHSMPKRARTGGKRIPNHGAY